MNKNNTLFPIVATILIVMAMVSSAAASGETDVQVRIIPIPPNINDATLKNLDGVNVSTIDVNREYKVVFCILDKNGIDDIESIHVKLFYAGDGNYVPQEFNKRCMYEVVWENTTQGTWYSTPSGYLGNTRSVKTLSPSLFEFSFPFILDKVAIPTGSENTWKVEIEVDDTSGLADTLNDISFDVNDYIEWSGIPAQIDLTSANNEPESQWTLDSTLSIQTCITSNTEVNVLFKANDFSMDDISIDASSYFDIKANSSPSGGSVTVDFSSPNSVPSELTKIYQDAYSEQCGLNPSVEGYIDCNTTIVSFLIDVSSGKTVPCVPAGSYMSTWIFSIERGDGCTL